MCVCVCVCEKRVEECHAAKGPSSQELNWRLTAQDICALSTQLSGRPRKTPFLTATNAHQVFSGGDFLRRC